MLTTNHHRYNNSHYCGHADFPDTRQQLSITSTLAAECKDANARHRPFVHLDEESIKQRCGNSESSISFQKVYVHPCKTCARGMSAHKIVRFTVT